MTTPQQDLIFKASFLPGTRGLAAWQAWRAWVDLDTFLDPGSYRLLPQLYRNLQKIGAEDPLMLKLKGVTRLHWSKNQLIFHRLEEINRLLRQAGIWPIVLGRVGLALAGQADTPLNPPNYYELLVRREEAMAAVRMLQKMGFQPVDGLVETSGTAWFEGQESCLLRDMQGRHVHLYWSLFGQPAGFGNRGRGVWEHARIFKWNGDTFRVPGLEDQLLYITWQNGALKGPTSFLQAIDIMLVLKTPAERLDGTKLRSFARELGLTRQLQHILYYIRYTLGDNCLPEGLESMLKWPFPVKEQLGYQLNICRVISWENFPSEWWSYLRENSKAPRLKKVTGFARVMRRNWQEKYILQVPVLGIAWLGRKVLHGTD